MERKLHMKIGGMFCVNCASRIEKKLAGDTIEISYDFLSESKGIFANWKTAVK